MEATHTKAYKIFISELETHLTEASEILAEGEVLSEEQAESLQRRFHTVKGGAGFFGLTEIARVAGTLEDMLVDASASVITQLDTIKGLIHELEESALKIPSPKE